MKKRIYPTVLAVTLSMAMTMQSFAAGWLQVENDWYWLDESEQRAKDSWLQDSDGHWYHLDKDGKMETGWKLDPAGNCFYLEPNEESPMGSMVTGWKLINNVWYFFNTIHDGTYGKILTGWQWIDGYCYYFSEDGKMLSNTATPDGYQVNGSGAWLENGTPIYVKGKGIITKEIGSSSTSTGKSDSGGSGGGGGGSSSNNKMYSYTVNCYDKADGHLIKSYNLSAKKSSSITLNYEFDGYSLVPGQLTQATLSSNNAIFNLYYESNIEMPEAKFYSYKIVYRDMDTDDILKSESFKGEKDAEITIEYPSIAGYEVSDDQEETLILDVNNKVVTIYYQKVMEEKYSFTTRFVERSSGDILGEKIGRIISGTKVTIDFPDFEGYKVEESQKNIYQILDDDIVITIYYSKIKDPGIATPSEPDMESYTYTVNCYDFESEELIGTFSHQVDAGTVITINYPIVGYTVCEEYTFEIDEDDLILDIYYTKDEVIKTYSYVVSQIDMATKGSIGELTFNGTPGEVIDLEGLELSDYELLGNPPDTITISSVESNNRLKLYYKKIVDLEPDQEEVNFNIEFVDVDNPNTKILSDVTGTGIVGEQIPIYFYETIRTSDGHLWESIGKSPRMFELISTDYNVFTIEYRCTDKDPAPENSLVEYSIKYVAEDTGAVLGITSGFGTVGSKVSFRNNLGTTEYGILNPSITKLQLSKEENDIEVVYKRIAYPAPDANLITGEYDGSNWTVVFIDGQGNHLMTSVNGFSLKDSKLIVDYPNIIEVEDRVYRAKKTSPYSQIQVGTAYKQIVIEYEDGDESVNKLETWKQKAQEAKDEITGTQPLSYYISYKERNSWNDIALRVGVGSKDSFITVPVPDITDYNSPGEKIESFKLIEDGITKTVYYSKDSGNTSSQMIKTPYSVYFQDEDGKDLFESYTGFVASKTDEWVTKLPIYYPKTFIDKEGHIWEADESAPGFLMIDTLSQNENANIITYHKTFNNPKDDMVVSSNQDALTIFETITSRISNSREQKFYLIGKDYSPKKMNPGSLMALYGLVNYSNEIVDSFEYNGVVYSVSEIYISRAWEEATCTHEWHVKRTVQGSCLVNGNETLECDKCQKTVNTIVPAIGHIDLNQDSVCDVCGLRAFEQIIGDEILVDIQLDDNQTKTVTFICIDDNYQNTGKMLYFCADDIDSAIYGEYSYNSQVRFEDSALRSFLNDSFADGLSVKAAMKRMDSDRVSILTKDEVDYYKTNASNKYIFPAGEYLTKTSTNDKIVLSTGTEVEAVDAVNYPARPIILLDQPVTEQPSYNWKVGDVQSREVGGEIYLFRCVNESYKDKTNTSKKMALFLCDSIIAADIVDDNSTETIETLFFGTNNNYKYSKVKSWLEDNATDKLFDATLVNVGVDSAYSGSTQLNGFSSLNERLLSKHTLSTQYIESKLFVLSVEEALQVKDYLWKFGDTNMDNPETQMKPFSYSYWLRTPEYNTTDKIYTVNLETGRIESKAVTETNNNVYSETGIRPAFTMTQFE